MNIQELRNLISEEIASILNEVSVKEGQFALTKRPLQFIVGGTNRWTQQHHEVTKPEKSVVLLKKFVKVASNTSRNNVRGKKDVWMAQYVTKTGISKYIWAEISQSDLEILSPEAESALKQKFVK